MIIFFTSSIRSLKNLKQNLDSIYNSIIELKHQYIGNYPFKVTEEEVYLDSFDKNIKLFNDMDNFMKDCDLMILEVSKHSASMGYMIMRVLTMKKPVIALYVKQHKPAFLVGIEDENFQLIEYAPANVKQTLKKAIKFAEYTGNIRFNMMLSPKMSLFLKESAEKEGLSKATLIRTLLENYKKDNHILRP
ncbi:hypothetical protein KA089_00955 [Candidatus Woesebacteria bacterium]|nr:hypothetical protein [Candidatus Woesebacteria bacterium]